MFALGQSHQLLHFFQVARNDVNYGGEYLSDNDTFQGDFAVAANLDGRLEVFGANRNGDLSNKWQINPGVRWWVWSGLGGSLPANAMPTVIRDVQGRLHVFVRWAEAAGRRVGHRWTPPDWRAPPPRP